VHQLRELSDHLKQWLTSTEVLEAVLGRLRDLDPIVVVGGNAVVTRHPDVLEVLENSRDFGVSEVYAARMRRTTGSFVLGMEDTPQYRSEAAFIRSAVQSDDLPRLRAMFASEAARIIGRARASRRLDAAGGYAHRLPLRLVQDFFGVAGPDSPTLARWMRTMFWDIFLNLGDDAAVSAAAMRSSDELRPYLRELIAARQRAVAQGVAVPDDFVTRLVQSQEKAAIDDDGVRRSIGGVIVGAVDTTSKATVLALDQLLRRPAALAEAQAAARAGDDRLVSAYVFEALRFNPHNSIIVRTCHRDTTIAAGTERETRLERGTTVYAATLSAMFDESVVDDPEEFRAGRPASNYLHFGRGQHSCFGERINLVTIPEAVKQLLLLPNLRRAPGDEGDIVFDGPFPERYVVEFD
jgi:cytochrome P450